MPVPVPCSSAGHESPAASLPTCCSYESTHFPSQFPSDCICTTITHVRVWMHTGHAEIQFTVAVRERRGFVVVEQDLRCVEAIYLVLTLTLRWQRSYPTLDVAMANTITGCLLTRPGHVWVGCH